MLETLKAKIIISIIFALLAVGATWRVLSWREEAHKVPGLEKQIEANNTNNAGLQKSSSEFQKGKGEMDAKAEPQKEAVENEIKTVVIYRDCVLPDNGVQLINAAITSRIK